ncbi:MAG: alkaline shock response membrane anchor protein AmaP [Clostridia bacterium]|nr:alkaline shock response membrane anchor protein AmaP [Clostridia bacterium]
MRFLENLFIKIFSLIVLVLSVIVILIGFDILEINLFSDIIKSLYSTELKSKITLVISIIFILVSVKILLTRRGKPKNSKDGIILENGSGKLIISRESLDNMIFNASKDVPGAENITSKTYLDLEQNLRIFVTVTVSSDVSIKDISTRLQAKIKSTIKQTADLDVSEVNVKIKNIVNKKVKKSKENNIKTEVIDVNKDITTEGISEENKIEE